MRIRENVQAVIDGILKGHILGTFDRWYADDVVTRETGVVLELRGFWSCSTLPPVDSLEPTH